MRDTRVQFSGAKITFLATIASNASIGLTIGGFSISLLAIQREFATSLALAALALSLAILTLGVFPPIVVRLQQRFSIRNTMVAGAMIAAAAYVVLSFVTSIWALLVIYALVLGPSTVMFGQFASSILASNWYIAGRGRVLGIIGMPILIMLVPLGGAPILADYGLRTFYLVLAAAHVLLIPILAQVIDRPEDIGQRPKGEIENELSRGPELRTTLSLGFFVVRWDFWLLVLAVGILNGSGISKTSHLAAIASEQGRTLHEAALLMAVAGGSGIVGSIGFGWLADLFGGAATLAINAGLQVATWSILLFHPQMPLLILDGFIMGSCGAGVFSLVAVVCSQLYAPVNIGRSLALVNSFSTPLIFAMPPIAGAIHDQTSSYSLVIMAMMAACTVSGAMFALVVRGEIQMRRLNLKSALTAPSVT